MNTKIFILFYILLVYFLCLKFFVCTVNSSSIQFQHNLVKRNDNYDNLLSELKSKGSRMR